MQESAEKRQTNPNVNDIPSDVETTDIEREGWQADELGEQSASQDSTEIARQILRSDKPKESADENDLAGSDDINRTAFQDEEK